LLKRAEDVEAELEPVKQELATLKGQIKDMWQLSSTTRACALFWA
jgi:hypothetical protein